jgi:hypothetical protein
MNKIKLESKINTKGFQRGLPLCVRRNKEGLYMSKIKKINKIVQRGYKEVTPLRSNKIRGFKGVTPLYVR